MISAEIEEALAVFSHMRPIAHSVVMQSYQTEDWKKLARYLDWMLLAPYDYSPRVQKAAQVLATHTRGEWFRRQQTDLDASP